LIHIILGNNIPFPFQAIENAPCAARKDPAVIHRHLSWKEKKKSRRDLAKTTTTNFCFPGFQKGNEKRGRPGKERLR
jgi:hypothetical protein